MSVRPERVVLYTQRGCTDSRKVRDGLTERGLPFVERDVTSTHEAAREPRATGIFAPPLLVAGDERLVGFRPDKLAALFGQP